jgi:Tfp pilus assembly protein PilE
MVIVVLILGILVAVAIPSYVGLSERADKSAATTNVRAVVSDVEAYYSDWGSFDGISPSVLHNNYDSSIDISLIDVSSTESGASFMLCSKSHSFYAYKAGPASPVQTDTAQPTGCGL